MRASAVPAAAPQAGRGRSRRFRRPDRPSGGACHHVLEGGPDLLHQARRRRVVGRQRRPEVHAVRLLAEVRGRRHIRRRGLDGGDRRDRLADGRERGRIVSLVGAEPVSGVPAPSASALPRTAGAPPPARPARSADAAGSGCAEGRGAAQVDLPLRLGVGPEKRMSTNGWARPASPGSFARIVQLLASDRVLRSSLASASTVVAPASTETVATLTTPADTANDPAARPKVQRIRTEESSKRLADLLLIGLLVRAARRHRCRERLRIERIDASIADGERSAPGESGNEAGHAAAAAQTSNDASIRPDASGAPARCQTRS